MYSTPSVCGEWALLGLLCIVSKCIYARYAKIDVEDLARQREWRLLLSRTKDDEAWHRMSCLRAFGFLVVNAGSGKIHSTLSVFFVSFPSVFPYCPVCMIDGSVYTPTPCFVVLFTCEYRGVTVSAPYYGTSQGPGRCSTHCKAIHSDKEPGACHKLKMPRCKNYLTTSMLFRMCTP